MAKKKYNFEKKRKKKRKLSPSEYKVALKNLSKAREVKRMMMKEYKQASKLSSQYYYPYQREAFKKRHLRYKKYYQDQIDQRKMEMLNAYRKQYSPTRQRLRNISEGVSKSYQATTKMAMTPYNREKRELGNQISKKGIAIFSALSSLGSMFGSKDENLNVSGNRGRPIGSISGKYLDPRSGTPVDVITYKKIIADIRRQKAIADAKKEFYLQQQKQNTQQSQSHDINPNTEVNANEVLDSNQDLNIDYNPLEGQDQEILQEPINQYPMTPSEIKARDNLEKIKRRNEFLISRGKRPMYKEVDLSEGRGFTRASWRPSMSYTPWNQESPFKKKNLMKNESEEEKMKKEYLKYLQEQQKFNETYMTTINRNARRISR